MLEAQKSTYSSASPMPQQENCYYSVARAHNEPSYMTNKCCILYIFLFLECSIFSFAKFV